MRASRWHAIVLIALALAVGCPSIPRPCAAADPPAWLDEVTLDGFLSTSFSYNFNRPTSGTNQFRVFDFDDNTFKVDVFELVAQKAVARPRDAGFRVDLTVGSSVPRVTASAGLFRDETGQAEDIDAQQAFVSWIAPLGSGLRLDFGKFVTPTGYEVIEGFDGWNDNATRSFLFGYAIPFTHVGARASYALSSRATVLGMVVNGWDVARDNNRAKTVGAQLALTPAPALSVLVSGLWGPERPGDNGDLRTLFDAVAILKPAPRWTFGANLDWGSDENAVAPGGSADWQGVAGYLRFACTPSFALVGRGESFRDRDGARTGVAQTLSELTVTLELRLTPHLLVRSDLRFDRSSRMVFEKSPGVSRRQTTVLLGVIDSF